MRRSLLRVLAAATAPVAAMACTRSAPDQTAAPTPQITLEQVLSIADAGAPAWSPDGRRLAFSWGTGTQRNLWVADADATTPGRPGDTSLQQIAPLVARGGAVVSPDWRRMAFTAKQHIWVLPLDGGRPVQVTSKEGRYSGLNWSPARMLMPCTRYGSPVSSSMMCTLWPLGVGQLYTSIMFFSSHSGKGSV